MLKNMYHVDGTLPQYYEVFVFGSNLSGIHGAGAAKVAAEKFGAVRGVGFGFSGLSFAIPTKGFNLEVLSLNEITMYVNAFKSFVEHNQDMKFFITRVGCGLAGYKDSDIAPLFVDITGVCSFASEWKKYLE